MMDNESGIAFGFYSVILLIIAAGLILAVTAPMVNGLSGYANDRIADGGMSAQTASAISWNVSAFIWLPVFALLGFLLWSVVRPLEQKRLGR